MGWRWTSAAAERATANTPEALQDAAAEADLAARLNPMATRPLFVAAAIAARRDRLLEARAHLLEAADRAPDDPQVWVRLALLAQRLADRPGYLQASRRRGTKPHRLELRSQRRCTFEEDHRFARGNVRDAIEYQR